MSMLTLNEADNKEILYTSIDIDFRYSLIVYSKLVSCALISMLFVYGQLEHALSPWHAIMICKYFGVMKT